MKVWLVIKESDDGTSIAHVCSTYERAEKLCKSIVMGIYSHCNKYRKRVKHNHRLAVAMEKDMRDIKRIIKEDKIYDYDLYKHIGVSLTIEAQEVIK